MAPKKTNDDFDLYRMPDGADEFDIFQFSDDELNKADLGHVEDDLDLDSFLDFDESFEPEDKPETEPVYTPEDEPMEPEAAVLEDEDEFEDGLEFEDEPEPPRRKRGLFGLFKKAEPEMDEDEPENEAVEDTPETVDEPVDEPMAVPQAEDEAEALEDEPKRPSFWSRLVRRHDPWAEEAEAELPEEALPDEDALEKKPALFRSLFAKKLAPEAADESQPEDEAETADEPEKKAAGAKISFFTRTSPEKENFDSLMQAKKEEERARRHALTTADNASLAAQLPREPKRDEMLVYDSELDDLDYVDADDMPEARDYLPIRFRRYGRSGLGGGLMYALFVISLSIILACFGWLCAADVLALSKDEVHAAIAVESYVPSDTDTLNEDGEPVNDEGNVITCNINQVADALKENDIINFKFLFKLFAKLSHANTKIDPGTYDVSTTLDYRALITEMQTGSGSQEVTKITFPEGYRMEQIFELLEDNDICDYDDLMEAAAEHDFSYSWLEEDWYLNAKGDPTRLEGYLFPDTYEFYQGENAINVINRFLLRFHGLLTQDMYQQAENCGITLHEAVIIASLIEKEAGAEDDRSNFSSVIYNRLHSGWKLQLDSTVNYIKNTSTFNLSYADISIDNPYNTYVYEGLPKGPICSPGLASINAALNPNSTDYWYWYAYEGVTHFFTNSDDFNSFAEAHPY